MAAFAYKLQMLRGLNTECFAAYFDNLPIDLYNQGENRRRRYSRLSSSSGKLSLLEHKAFVQSSEVNHLMAGVERNFRELEDDLIKMKEFQSLVATFIGCSEINQPVMEIGVHQIRTVANWREKGQPSPEGIHQDGFEVVGIFSVKRERVVGGETQLYKFKEEPPILTRLLMPGALLTLNDRELFHFTTPIFSTDGGMRDVFVFTA
jgi:hypothetical protein